MTTGKPISLVVEYDGADDFVADYTANLATGGTFVLTPRALAPDSTIRLVMQFPGLLDPIAIDAIVKWSRGGDQPGVGVEFDDVARSRLAELAGRIEERDPVLLSRVIKVLVVEDNPHMAELIRAGLRATASRDHGRELAFEFSNAENGADAIALLERSEFDVVIVDMYLPIVDGANVIGRARNDLGLVDLPIIAVSAGGVTARASALIAGASSFLDKPMRLRQMVDTMRALAVL